MLFIVYTSLFYNVHFFFCASTNSAVHVAHRIFPFFPNVRVLVLLIIYDFIFSFYNTIYFYVYNVWFLFYVSTVRLLCVFILYALFFMFILFNFVLCFYCTHLVYDDMTVHCCTLTIIPLYMQYDSMPW